MLSYEIRIHTDRTNMQTVSAHSCASDFEKDGSPSFACPKTPNSVVATFLVFLHISFNHQLILALPCEILWYVILKIPIPILIPCAKHPIPLRRITIINTRNRPPWPTRRVDVSTVICPHSHRIITSTSRYRVISVLLDAGEVSGIIDTCCQGIVIVNYPVSIHDVVCTRGVGVHLQRVSLV